jgi:hypothetical protein
MEQDREEWVLSQEEAWDSVQYRIPQMPLKVILWDLLLQRMDLRQRMDIPSFSLEEGEDAVSMADAEEEDDGEMKIIIRR